MDSQTVDRITEPFLLYLEDCKDLSESLALAQYGIEKVKQMPELLNTLDQLGKLIPLFAHGMNRGLTGEGRGIVDALALRAQQAQTSDFRFLYGQAAVSLWGFLEALFNNFTTAWLMHVPQPVTKNPNRQIRISIPAFVSMSQEERCREVARTLGDDVRGAQGVNRFEDLLGYFGLTGEVDEEIKEALRELQGIRNVLVHRRGIVDQKCREMCPSLNLSLGSRVIVTKDMFHRYLGSAVTYAIETAGRVYLRNNLGPGEFAKRFVRYETREREEPEALEVP